MKLEVGKKYLNERGVVAEVMRDDAGWVDRFVVRHECETEIYHYENGRANIGGYWNLISEYVEEKPVNKYKVGDLVRVIGNTYPRHYMKIGGVYEITEVKTLHHYGDVTIYGEDVDGDMLSQDVCLADVEPYTPTNTLTVGETYTSENGNTWECIAVKGDVAWLAGAAEGGRAAYTFKLDGSPICLGVDSRYRIMFAPRVERVYTKGSWAKKGTDVSPRDYVYALEFDLINGTPDWSTAKVSEA